MIFSSRALWIALVAAMEIAASGCAQSPRPSVEPPTIREPRSAASAATSPAPSAQELMKTLAALPPAAIPPGKPRFDELGCHAGEQLPAIRLAQLDHSNDFDSLQS